jgi:hypothetical protein
MRTLGMGLFAVLVVLIAVTGQGYADDSLSGRWDGRPPGDGTLELYLKLKDAKIDGEGRIKRGGRKPDAIFTVSGQVEGNDVKIQTHNTKTGSTVTYKCGFENADNLKCTTAKGHETTFTKVK